jgi:hypothetical protein
MQVIRSSCDDSTNKFVESGLLELILHVTYEIPERCAGDICFSFLTLVIYLYKSKVGQMSCV